MHGVWQPRNTVVVKGRHTENTSASGPYINKQLQAAFFGLVAAVVGTSICATAHMQWDSGSETEFLSVEVTATMTAHLL